jgi:hypothetical protein
MELIDNYYVNTDEDEMAGRRYGGMRDDIDHILEDDHDKVMILLMN